MAARKIILWTWDTSYGDIEVAGDTFDDHVQRNSDGNRSISADLSNGNYGKDGIQMIITTTPSIEGRQITDYLGVVFGEVISGVDFIKDFAAGLSNFFGGRSGTYEEELIHSREQAVQEMEQRARALGADAVVGVDIDYEVLGSNNGMLMVTASGTAVRYH